MNTLLTNLILISLCTATLGHAMEHGTAVLAAALAASSDQASAGAGSDSTTQTQKRLPCSQCHKSFANKHHLKRHMLAHSSEKHFQCSVCGKYFKTADNRNTHEKICGFKTTLNKKRKKSPDSEDTDYAPDSEDESDTEEQCRVKKLKRCDHLGCTKAFAYPCHLRKHKEKKHPLSSPAAATQIHPPSPAALPAQLEPQAITPSIASAAESPAPAASHAFGEGNEKTTFPCLHPECTSTFTLKDNRDRHMRTHNAEKLYKCDECGKALTRKGYVAKHKQKYHTGHYACDQQECGKSFKQETDLITHKEKYHPSISSAATALTTLEHVLLAQSISQPAHSPLALVTIAVESPAPAASEPADASSSTDEKPFKCDFPECGYASALRVNLKKHREIKHNGMFICSYCSKQISSKSNLTSHIKRMHPSTLFALAASEPAPMPDYSHAHSDEQLSPIVMPDSMPMPELPVPDFALMHDTHTPRTPTAAPEAFEHDDEQDDSLDFNKPPRSFEGDGDEDGNL